MMRRESSLTTEPESERQPRSRRLLWTTVLLMLAAAALLWAASAVLWVGQRYQTPFTGETQSILYRIVHENARPLRSIFPTTPIRG